MNFRVLMVHDFSAMVPGVEVHRSLDLINLIHECRFAFSTKRKGAGLHHGRRLLVVILVTISH